MNERSQVERDPKFVSRPQTKSLFDDLHKILPRSKSRDGERIYPIAPSDVPRVYVEQNLMNLAYDTQVALGLDKSETPHRVRATEVRSFLRQELETAFDVMEGRGAEGLPPLMDVEYIESVTAARPVYLEVGDRGGYLYATISLAGMQVERGDLERSEALEAEANDLFGSMGADHERGNWLLNVSATREPLCARRSA